MIEIKITASSPEEMHAKLAGFAALLSFPPVLAVSPAEAPDPVAEIIAEQQPELDLEPKEPKRRGRPPKAAPVEPSAVDKVIEAVASAPKVMTAAQAEAHMNPTEIQIAPTLEDAQHALRRLSGRKGYDVCRALLDTFGVPKVSALEPKDFARFIAAADEKADEA